mmetsp:Transcript_46174/g.142363  ORF Transcript_46174/g.142363 Transcript_46174/m.142363 type:complete len:310 (-) Transcript_46174:608-1537(-)
MSPNRAVRSSLLNRFASPSKSSRNRSRSSSEKPRSPPSATRSSAISISLGTSAPYHSTIVDVSSSRCVISSASRIDPAYLRTREQNGTSAAAHDVSAVLASAAASTVQCSDSAMTDTCILKFAMVLRASFAPAASIASPAATRCSSACFSFTSSAAASHGPSSTGATWRCALCVVSAKSASRDAFAAIELGSTWAVSSITPTKRSDSVEFNAGTLTWGSADCADTAISMLRRPRRTRGSTFSTVLGLFCDAAAAALASASSSATRRRRNASSASFSLHIGHCTEVCRTRGGGFCGAGLFFASLPWDSNR